MASTPERSSYNGLVLMVFIALSALLPALGIYGLASRKLRRAGAWDCGYPETSSATQYTAASFAQPIRRVFASVVFSASEQIDMPLPGDARPARLTLGMKDPVWTVLYRPLVETVNAAAAVVGRARTLSIRQHLSLVYAVLILLLVVLALWQ